MSFRGIPGTSAEIDVVRDLVNGAMGFPRCERLAGNARRANGGSVRTCPCTVSTSPVASCPHATRFAGPKVTLTTAGVFATPIDESNSAVMTAIGPANVALIRVIRDNEIKSFTRGEIGP